MLKVWMQQGDGGDDIEILGMTINELVAGLPILQVARLDDDRGNSLRLKGFSFDPIMGWRIETEDSP